MTSFRNPATMRRWATETGNAAGAEIEEFVLLDLAGGGAVGAANVVGQNFEAGH